MQGWGLMREVPLLTTDSIRTYFSGEPRGIRYAFNARCAFGSGDKADNTGSPGRADIVKKVEN